MGILLQRYTLLVFGVCMKYLKDEQNAKDATQQVYIKCIAELQKYSVDYFKSWLYMVTKNHCLMQLRKHPLKDTIEIETLQTNKFEEQNIEFLELIKEKEITLDLMNNSIKELSEEQQQCINLFYFEKNSYQEVANKLNLSYLQVKSFIQNGKRNLKIIIEQKLKMHK